MDDLDMRAREALRVMEEPRNANVFWSALHGVARDLGGDYAQAVGAVFRIVSEVAGVKYGSQYMSNVIVARFKDGTLMQRLRG